jgi:mono/diheme cytochrome c family protein
MVRSWYPALACMVLLLVAAGCGTPSSVGPDRGSDATGMELFNERVVGASPGCVTCHSLEPGVTLVGPSLAGIGERAEDRVPGVTAEEYLRQSIVSPDAFVVEGFATGSMQSNWENLLSQEQIDSLVLVLLDL